MATQSFLAHHRRALDAELHRVFRRLPDLCERLAFEHLLALVRARSDLMSAPPVVVAGEPHFRQVRALRNLARHHRELRPTLDGWTGAHGHPLAIVASLARAAFELYPTPRFLASVWFEVDSAAARERRAWVLAHGRGASLRALPLPIELTRRMAHLILATPDHVGVVAALRRAELLGLGASPDLVDAVLATRLGRELAHGAYWREVLAWLVRRGDEVELAQVGPVIDYLDEVRREDPAPPRLRGRTFASVMRDVVAWHEALRRDEDARRRAQARRLPVTWSPSRWHPLRQMQVRDDARVHWEIIELLDRASLQAEGRALRHCVASYAERCRRGWSSIWSVRQRVETPDAPGEARPVMTIEVLTADAAVAQVRGFANARPSGPGVRVVRAWVHRERLALSPAVARELAQA